MATTATAAAPAQTGAEQAKGDVLVVFGITGDLAKVMTFRSLYRLEARGLLDVPIVGVAVDDWSVDDLKERARTSIEGTGEKIDQKVFDSFAERLSYVSGDFTDPATYERVGAAIHGATTPVFYLEIPPFLFGQVVKQLSDAGLTKGATRCRREAVRPRPGVGGGARRRAAPVHRRVAAVPDRPLPREDGRRRDHAPPLPERDPRADLEPEPGRSGRDHDGRVVRRRGSRPLLRPGRCVARRRRQPPDAGGGGSRHGGAVALRRGHTQELGRRALPLGRRGEAGELCAWPVRRLPLDRRRRRELDHGDVRGAPARDRELALVGCPVLHPDREAAARHADRVAARLQAAATARASHEDGLRTQTSSSSGWIPRRGFASSSTPTAPTREARRRSRSTWSSPRRAARVRRPTRSSCTRRSSATPNASRGRTPWKRRGA